MYIENLKKRNEFKMDLQVRHRCEQCMSMGLFYSYLQFTGHP